MPTKLAWAYNLMGLVFYEKPNPDYKKALFYYFKALQINNINNLQNNNGFVLLRIGSTYCKLTNYSRANYYLTAALKLGDSLNLRSVQFWSLEGLTQLYKDKKEYALALIYAEKTLKIALNANNDKPGIIIAYRNFSELNYLLNNTKNAIPNIDSAIQYSLRYKIYQTLPQIYLLKSTILELDNNINSSFNYYKMYVKTKDSLFNIQNNKNINDLEATFDSKQKQKRDKRRMCNKASTVYHLLLFY